MSNHVEWEREWFPDFDAFDKQLETTLISQWAEERAKVDTGHWQGLKDVPHTQTRELQYVSFQYPIPVTQLKLEGEVQPNMRWAEAHFQERVGGEPLNPGEQYKNWPWYKGGVEDHKKTGQFSHTYMERYWPKWANENRTMKGVRYEYGDLQDVVNLLAREPTTRQAYLPVWFPEDTGSCGEESQRVPCSLGYHFMMRDGKLNCMYHMRSCDLVRYFRDDVYLTCRLVQWVLSKLQDMELDRLGPAYFGEHGGELWISGDNSGGVRPGTLHMTIASLHIFEGDVPMLRRKYGAN